jgi:starvation-inducible DNA-binding protein
MEIKTKVINKKSENVTASLKALLADEHVLAARVREASENVNGRNIGDLRRLFDRQRQSLDIIVADVSKRVRALGQVAPTMSWASLAATRLKRHNERFTKQDQIIEALLDDHDFMIRILRLESVVDEKTDISTAGFMIGLLGQHVEMVVALRNWLK